MPELLQDDTAFHELKILLNEVALDVAPSEKLAFDQARRTLLGAKRSPVDPQRRDMRTVPGVVEAGLLSLHLLAGTLAIIEMYKAKRARERDDAFEREIHEEWQKALIDAGMSAELARMIPVSRTADVIRFIAKQRMQPGDGNRPGQ